jgi:hypothetical protein
VSNKPFEDSTTDDPGSMVKISDKTDYTRFVRPTSEDEGIWLDHEEVHLVKHPVGQVKEMHVHDPPQASRHRHSLRARTLDDRRSDLRIATGCNHRLHRGSIRRDLSSASPVRLPTDEQAVVGWIVAVAASRVV